MILFKVNFENNVAITAAFTLSQKPIIWKEHPYRIISLEVYANNNVHAIQLAQTKADILLKKRL